MTNKEILEEVHSKCRDIIARANSGGERNPTAKLLSDFIEQEWQKADEDDGCCGAR
jgi:hypothetical protein